MKKKGIKIISALVLFLVALLIKFNNEWINNIIFIIAYIIVGLEILKKAIRNIKRGKIFDENFLMSVATLGAFGIGEFPEAVAVMLFYQIGELFQSYAVDKSRKSIVALMDIRPDYANIKKDGDLYCDYNASGRFFMPEEVAETVAFMVSDCSKCISGEIIHCDAGNHLNPYF